MLHRSLLSKDPLHHIDIPYRNSEGSMRSFASLSKTLNMSSKRTLLCDWNALCERGKSSLKALMKFCLVSIPFNEFLVNTVIKISVSFSETEVVSYLLD